MPPQPSTALVTGGGRRIGAACVLALAQRGATVVIHHNASGDSARALADAIRERGGRAHPLSGDLADQEATQNLIDRAEAAAGRPIDILINNAAIFHPGLVADTPVAAWNRHLAINLTAPFLLMQRFARRLPPGAPGVIIQLIDRHGHRPRPGYAAYSASKSALWTLTRQAALELAPRIRVNAIGPGPILPAPDAGQAAFDAIGAATPAGRAGSPDDIVRALLFLLDNDLITGEMIRVDGGEHLR